jgi:putative S-adenosyl-L-methionine-dependent methyltransferase
MADHETEMSSAELPIKPESRVLETGVPLSQSVIWRLQRDFYTQRGLKAWTEDMVPAYITNNPFIAEMYAQIVAAYLVDCMGQSPLSPEAPLRILELGAGTGKFAYLFLRKITALLQAKNIDARLLHYCMSDCSEDLLTEWRHNSYLAGFVSSGILEFKLLRAEENKAQQALAVEKKGPLVVIANYVFDSLPQDAFVIADGKIFEAMVTTVTSGDEDGAPLLSGLQLSFNNVPLVSGRYADESWNAILEHYRSRLPAATVLLPSSALGLLQQLSSSSDGRMMVLAADKGFTREDDLALVQGPPAIEFHARRHCFSQQVNFDAFARYFWGPGGEALFPAKHFANLSICAFLQRRQGDEFSATRKAYEETLAGFGPDDLFALMSWLNAHLEEVSVLQALALLRLTRWDPTALVRLFPVIVRQIRSVTAERKDLRNAVLSVWANHYPVSAAENVLAFHCGVILLELRFFAEALAMFKTSEQTLGRTAATSYNLGLCAIALGRSADALEHMVEACNLDPTFEPARSSRLKLEQEKSQGDKA